jgi:dTDP-4-dehydrorhamnose 3,5-epimerase
MPFKFTRLQITELICIEPHVFADERGFFMEAYKLTAFSEQGIPQFVQENYSHSTYGVLRGLHYQKEPAAQGKLVCVIHGEIYDVALDIRVGSPTYGHWSGLILSAENRRMLYLPEGFAHGFCVVSATAGVVYKATAEYAPACDRGIAWNDPGLNIDWPIKNPILSQKDTCHPTLAQADNTFVYQKAFTNVS